MELTEGDIFFWRWKDEDRHGGNQPFGRYHRKSCKAIVKDGVLQDTYFSSLNRYRLNLNEVDIDYQGNIKTLEEIPWFDAPYYRPEDIVDMRHDNSSSAKVYRKPGASRDADTMREMVRHSIERSEFEIRIAHQRIEQLQQTLRAIESGDLASIDIPGIR